MFMGGIGGEDNAEAAEDAEGEEELGILSYEFREKCLGKDFRDLMEQDWVRR